MNLENEADDSPLHKKSEKIKVFDNLYNRAHMTHLSMQILIQIAKKVKINEMNC